MPKANKKQRHETKRKSKRLAMRRRESNSPVKRLADAPGEPECWMSSRFETDGQMQIFAYKRGAGLTGLAAFLVDRGVVGLKDAWVRMDLARGELEEMLEACRRRGIGMRRASIEEVRRWVAGGARWAHDNGMRLPKEWSKPASLVGGIGDWYTADVSGFVMEFAGHPEDLRQRLLSEPLDSYLRRSDIDFVFDTDAPYMDQKTGKYSDEFLDEDEESEALSEEELEAIAADVPEEELNTLAAQLLPAAQSLFAKTTAWLDAQGETPSPGLLEAWTSLMLARLLTRTAMPDADEDESAEIGFELLRSMAGRIEAPHRADYDRAVGQALRHLETDSMMMRKAVLKHGLAQAQPPAE